MGDEVEEYEHQTSIQNPRPSYVVSTMLSTLPREKWWGVCDLYQWQGQWLMQGYLESTIAFQSHFEAHDDDILVTSFVKTGTTWLKALVTCIVDGSREADDGDGPLAFNFPHALVRGLEWDIYMGKQDPDFSSMPSPRMFSSHLFYNLLPESIRKSKCKMVYITRNPKDAFVSMYHFMNEISFGMLGAIPIKVPFESFCNGAHFWGPFFDHVLGYWKESLKQPEKILFLKYEELKKNPREEVKRLASFLGRPFLNDEEVDKVLWRCSLDRLKNLEVNKNGLHPWTRTRNSSFFRLGQVGDWKNIFTPEMSQRLDQIMRSKLDGSGLELES